MSDLHFQLGKYRLLELLYEGHHTEVWLAENIKIRKKLAIKILTQGLIHRDIKPQSILLKTRNMLLLGDFGLVTRFHEKHYPWMKMEFGGTRIYMAPWNVIFV